ncbi:MAG: tyrosine-type recombinase/integrase [Planctomycetota bacterium]
MQAYLDYLLGQGRASTARTVHTVLDQYAAFLATRQRTPASATAADVGAYRLHLASAAASTTGGPLAVSTQASRLASVKGFHRFLRRRGLVVHDVTQTLELPRFTRRTVRKDWLDQQEAQALLATAAERVAEHPTGGLSWAVASRDLAVVALALATGRRRSGLCGLRLRDLDPEESELRVAWEKGRPGRVLPVAGWAVRLVVHYRDRARPILLAGRTADWLFVGQHSDRLAVETYVAMLNRLHARTCASHPDLRDLPAKRLTTHSLRVTFARTLFANGCNIRSINEMMLHTKLSTTAAYTPIPLEEMRRVLRAAHPRA